MSGAKAADAVPGRIAKQVPAFVAIGLIGYVIDAGITFTTSAGGSTVSSR